MFCKKGVLKNFAKFPGKELRVAFLIKLQASGLLLFKKRLWYGCFPVNLAIFPKFLVLFHRTSPVAASV